MYDDYGVQTHFGPQIKESDPAQSVPLEASTRKERFGEKKLHLRRYSFCNKPLQTCGDRVIFWSFGNLIACTMTMGQNTLRSPKAESDPAQSVPLEASIRKECFERKNTPSAEVLILQLTPANVPRPGDYLELSKLDCLWDDSGVKTHYVPQIEESDLSHSVAMEASTRKECFERKKLHPRRYSFCNHPPQTSGDRVIIWSLGNLIACTMTMGSKHSSFPKWKSQTPLKVCPWKRPLARSVLREKSSIRGGTHFAIIPFKRPETG